MISTPPDQQAVESARQVMLQLMQPIWKQYLTEPIDQRLVLSLMTELRSLEIRLNEQVPIYPNRWTVSAYMSDPWSHEIEFVVDWEYMFPDNPPQPEFIQRESRNRWNRFTGAWPKHLLGR